MSEETKGLLPEERRRMILAQLSDRGSVRVIDLAEQLGVTAVTIRRDLELLGRRGAVKRVHGGVTLRDQKSSLPSAPATGSTFDPQRGPETNSRIVGMVVPSLDYYWPSVARGAKERAASRDIKIVLRDSAYESPEQDRKQIEHLVEKVGAHGLILTVDVRDKETLDLIQSVVQSGIPVVLIERNAELSADGVPMESVTSDHHTGAVLAVRTLTDMGHERIGIVCPAESPTTPQLRAGWEHACKDRGIKRENTMNALVDNVSPDSLMVELSEILDLCLSKGITGLLVHADAEANMMVQVAQQRGLSVPEDLSVVAYDDEVASLFTPALTAVRPPRNTIGQTAVDLISTRLLEPGRPLQRVIIAPRLTIRESTDFPRTEN